MSLALAFLMVLCLGFGAGQAHAVAEPKVILDQFGSVGSGPGQFSTFTLAVNSTGAGGVSAGDLFLLDGGNRRVQRFSKDGDFVSMFGRQVNVTTGGNVCTAASGDTCGPAAAASATAGSVSNFIGGIAIDQDTGLVYVSNPAQKRVDVFSAQGVFQGAFGGGVSSGGTALQFCTATCLTGTTGALGGQFGSGNVTPRSLAVNPANGNILVADAANFRIQEFAPTLNGSDEVTGVSFVGAFGWDVVSTGPNNANQIENVIVQATGGTFTVSLGGETTSNLPYDSPASTVESALEALPNIGPGNVDVTGGPGGPLGLDPYSITFVGALQGLANGAVTAASGSPSLIGSVSVPAPMNPGASAQFEVCTTADICKVGTQGAGSGQLAGAAAASTFTDLQVDSAGRLYVLTSTTNCVAPAGICRTQRFSPSGRFAADFAPAQLRVTDSTYRPVSLAIDPESDEVYASRKLNTSPGSYGVQAFSINGDLLETYSSNVSDVLTGAAPNAGPIAAGVDDRLYYGAFGEFRVFILGPTPPAEPTVPVCADVQPKSANCLSTITIPAIASGGAETSYRFEYTTNGVTWTRYPATDVQLGNTPGPTLAEETITGLTANTLYQVRVCATTSVTVCTEPTIFTTTTISPDVRATWAEEVTESTAVMGAEVHPQNLATTYWFEWATDEHWQQTGGLDRRVPAFDRQAGSGAAVIKVQEAISGLAPGAVYRYRVVARSSAGTTEGPVRTLSTLNACGFASSRCLEVVSPRDEGPIAASGKVGALGGDLLYQASSAGSALAYTIAAGLPDATAGLETLYLGSRTGSDWTSTQLSPPAIIPSALRGDSGHVSRTKGLSPDLSCGVVVTPQPLTDDAPEQVVEAGGGNMFVRRGGVYTVVTHLPPTPDTTDDVDGIALEDSEYHVLGMSDDCSRVVFETPYRYPGIPTATSSSVGDYRLYEWDNGTLRGVGTIPATDGEVEVPAIPGTETNSWNMVSADGSRVFFSAVSAAGGNEGSMAVFVRRDAGDGERETIDVSQRAGGTSESLGAHYQTASRDGRYVFFLSNYGLTPDSSSGASTCQPRNGATNLGNGAGCDLYRYDVQTDTLKDVSADTADGAEQNAGVVGVLDASHDGSHVYFAARGQLVPGAGKRFGANVADGTYNVILARDSGAMRHVGIVRDRDLSVGDGAGVLLADNDPIDPTWTSRSTPDGKHLVFGSTGDVTGFDSDGKIAVYRYSEETDTTECVSCRRDGLPMVAPASFNPLTEARWFYAPVTITADGSRIFFQSLDPLATGAVSGRLNLYEWHDGQVSLLTTEMEGLPADLTFAGASADGSDVFFVSSADLNWEDTDGRADVYDARIGGGFDPPTVTPPAECDPLSESECQLGGSAPTPTDTKTSFPPDGQNVEPGIRNTLAVSSLSTKARRKASRTGRLSLSVRASSPGRVSLTVKAKIDEKARRVGRTSKRIDEAGRLRLRVRLSFAARKRLRAGKALRLTVQVRQSGARTRTTSILLPGVKS